MNIEQLKAALRAAHEAFAERKTALLEAQRTIDEAADDADLAQLRTAYDEAASAFDEAHAELERCKGNLADGERRQKAIDDNPAVARAARVPDVRSLAEPLVYAADSEHSFFRDSWAWRQGDPVARERLERHGQQNLEQMREKGVNGVNKRDVGTGAWAGLTIPQYLVDEFAPYARAGSPMLNLIANKKLLPDEGMTLNIGRLTTPGAVAAQNGENVAVQETDMDDTLLTVNVRTYAGQQDVSRQALERSRGVDEEVYGDLVADYFTKLDAACINADGTNGTHLGIRSTVGIVAVTYTDASPTVPELYPKLADAIRQINGGVFAKATAILMHSRRWGWGTAALDTNSRPLFLPDTNGPFNALAVGDAAGYGQVMGKLHNLPVITDDNILTTLGAGTEDVILVVSGWNLRFWAENSDLMPRRLRFEETAGAPQTVRLAVWGYSAFTAGKYPLASAVVSGTGLIAPTF
jgi:HK97 family phage major capsid protein